MVSFRASDEDVIAAAKLQVAELNKVLEQLASRGFRVEIDEHKESFVAAPPQVILSIKIYKEV